MRTLARRDKHTLRHSPGNAQAQTGRTGPYAQSRLDHKRGQAKPRQQHKRMASALAHPAFPQTHAPPASNAAPQPDIIFFCASAGGCPLAQVAHTRAARHCQLGCRASHLRACPARSRVVASSSCTRARSAREATTTLEPLVDPKGVARPKAAPFLSPQENHVADAEGHTSVPSSPGRARR